MAQSLLSCTGEARTNLHVVSIAANEAAFNRAVEEVADVARRLIGSLHTASPPRDREVEAEKARARARERFA